MVWKDWSSWIKGGVIGLFTFIILEIFFNILDWINEGLILGFDLRFGFHYYLAYIFILFEDFLPQFFLLYVLPAILFIVIGTIIGWIVGKVKNR